MTNMVSLILWFWLKDQHIYLKKRGMTMALLVALGWSFNLLAGPVPRTNNDDSYFLHQCPVLNMTSILAVPTIILAGLTRVVLFRNRAKLHKLLAESSAKEFKAKRKEINRAWFFASDFYLYLFASLSFIFLFSGAFFATYQLCPELGGDECRIADNNDLRFTSFFFLGCVGALVIMGYVTFVLRTYPDPFNVLREIRKGILFAVVLAIPGLAFSSLNLGEPTEQDTVYFSYGVLLDIPIAIACIYLLPYQIYKSIKFNEFKAVYSDVTLDKVMRDPTGKALLKKHLINEFSVENINFIDAVEAFKALPEGDEKQLKATAIFDEFIAAGRLNIGVEKQTIERHFEDQGSSVGDDVFDEAFEIIWGLIETDAFRRFQGTADYLAYAGVNAQETIRTTKRTSAVSDV